MSQILLDASRSRFMINSTLRRGTHLVLSFSVVFLYWFYVFSKNLLRMTLSGGTFSSGTSSGSSHGTHSFGSEGDMELQARMELKRKRRMESNRVSAKRSRQRKQQHLDDLNSQVDQLRTTKQQLITALNNTTQNYAAAEAQNSVLRTQMIELESRLSALRDIIYYMNANQVSNAATINANPSTIISTTANYDPFGTSAWNSGMQQMVQQPIDHLLYQCF
ncbi:hypothetical protein BAE44_0012530 [Dichanthelium oligosanthes]|uniref:BZIP domain-containing protein n=1 Tax=Dichanthelium oligosanthes TaxID=888268 RepID=A0A1E5VMU6_9POAL|nr:hypothetical protein BAE44_0012530 [Dichanthelium oligosanthes]